MRLFKRRRRRVAPPVPPARAAPRTCPILLAASGREAVTVADGLARWDLRALEAPLATAHVSDLAWPVVGDGEVLVHAVPSASSDPVAIAVRRWSDFGEVIRVTLPGTGYGVAGMDLSPDGRTVAVGDLTEHITLVEVATGRTALLPEATAEGIASEIGWAPDGATLVALQVGQGGGSLHRYRLRPDGSVIEGAELPPGIDGDLADAVGTVACSRDGRTLVASMLGGDAGAVGIIRCYDLRAGELRWARELEDPGAAADPDGEGPVLGHVTVSSDGRAVLQVEGRDVLVLASATGELIERRPVVPSGPLLWLTASPTDDSFWVAVDGIPQRHPIART